MAETLTESFCERCGTRYEFRAPTRLNPLRKTRGIIGGLKTYLTGQDTLSDAIGDSMRTEQGALASAQLEAFHESFNFCIDCRQYTCVNCWNDEAGRCQTCVPVAGVPDVGDMLAATLAGGEVTPAPDAVMAEADLQARLGLEAWPSVDLPTASATNEPAEAIAPWPTAEPLVASAPPAAPEVADGVLADDGFVYETPRIELDEIAALGAEPAVADSRGDLPWEPAAAEVEPELTLQPEPEPVVAAEADERLEPAATLAPAAESTVEPSRPPLRVLSWDEDAAFEVEPEPVAAEVAPEPEPEPVAAEVAPEPEPEPVAAEVAPEPEPEPVAAEVAPEPEPEPVAAEVAPEPEPEPVAAEVAPEREPEPVAAEVAPEREPEPVAAEVAPEPEPEPVAAEVAPEPEPEPVAAEVAPEPEPEPVAQTVAPIGDTILRFPQRRPAAPSPVERVAAHDDHPEVAARRAQLEGLGLGDPGEGPVLPEPPAITPYRSRGAAVPQGELAARAVAQGISFWEASAREVAGAAAANVGVQNCGGCGLSLSASARFCRRCGTPQSRSA